MGYSDIKEMFTDAKNLATGANDLQLKSMLLDIQSAVYDLQEENRELRNRIHDMENDKIVENDLEFHGGVYVRKSDNRFFCARCWDNNHKLNSVFKRELFGYWCSTCSMGYPYVGITKN